MSTTLTDSTARPLRAPSQRRSTALRIGLVALFIAITAGVAETVVAVVSAVSADGWEPALLLQIGVRSAIYTAAFAMLYLLGRGRLVGWWVLLLGLGVVGLGTLTFSAAAQVVAGANIWVALGADTSVWFVAIRILHIVAVVVGSIALLVAGPAAVTARRRSL